MPAKKTRKPAKKKTPAAAKSKAAVQETLPASRKKTRAPAKKKNATGMKPRTKSQEKQTVAAKKPRQQAKKGCTTVEARAKVQQKKPAGAKRSRKPVKKETRRSTEEAQKIPQVHVKKVRERFNRLFSEIEKLAAQEPAEYGNKPRRRPEKKAQPLEASPLLKIPEVIGMQHELEKLRTYVQELETKLQNKGKAISTPELYEKEQVGYAFKDDTPLPLKISGLEEGAKAENTVQAPLVSSGETIGSVAVESDPNQPVDPEVANLLSTVAQQASLQIQSLRLLASAERARSAAEEATRSFMHESWKSYLDAIHQDERIGYLYDQASVTPYVEETDIDDESHREPVTVMDEQVGTLVLKNDPSQPLTEEDKKLVASIADQIAQQVENIRLLADASRARAEAEEATRRLTHESWQGFTENLGSDSLTFAYDSIKVSAVEDDASLPEKVSFTVPLEIRGEAVGQLAVAGENETSSDALDLAAAIASTASTHLETLRLTEELQKRAEELQELDRLKSGFLANMSHELRTPLNSILGFTDVLLLELDGPITPEMNNDLELIMKNGQHLLNLINEVLDMAKIESGRMDLIPEKFKVHDVLEDVNDLTSTMSGDKDINIYIEEDSDREVEIIADSTRVRQVMINLVNNAIKFTDQGEVALKAVVQDTGNIMVTVRDTGLGIPAEQLEEIFHEFTQVDTSTTRKVGGTGLGLPISRRLIEMHGGRLWAESTGVSGEGSTFFVELPLEARIPDAVKVEIEKRKK